MLRKYALSAVRSLAGSEQIRLIAGISIGYQAVRAATAGPAGSLRNE
ncbi:MAG TPA: hypothetical protein VGD92_08420 [Sphingobacteriaceae bacterium]